MLGANGAHFVRGEWDDALPAFEMEMGRNDEKRRLLTEHSPNLVGGEGKEGPAHPNSSTPSSWRRIEYTLD
ncbi:uncharacterized protein CCOS01_02628 [Colletotrichum costaricense]|uniref:Uncharacterized protein n=1 Tax=Colletotrichum costaricense TaxID=1209916 RepID=A0AAJ0E6L5_9PEZI|nr:uncharacterized protein CCOS01_02628 [Colletotrichum costaricense]KAI3539205.1 hypothetical protein CSPX01_09104 [Colletotrichum filicis]KAK1537308.1 hypothetical protein CCOS01_02628 [Colletotrichum costaricense]